MTKIKEETNGAYTGEIASISFDHINHVEGSIKGVTKFVKTMLSKARERSLKVLARDAATLEASAGKAQKILDSFIGTELGYVVWLSIYMLCTLILSGIAIGLLIFAITSLMRKEWIIGTTLLFILNTIIYLV